MSLAKAALLGLGLAAFYYFVMYDDGTSRQQMIQNTQNQVIAQQAELTKLQNTIAESKEIEALAADLADNMQVAIEAAPEDFNDLELMKILSAEAKVVGVSIVNLAGVNARRAVSRRGQSEKPPIFEPVKVAVKLEGTYNQLMLFLSNLTKTSRIIVPETLVLAMKNARQAGETASPTLEFAADFVGYKYNADGVASAE